MMVLEKIIFVSVIMGLCNYIIGKIFANEKASNYFKMSYKYYNTKVETKQFNKNDKEEVSYLQNKLFDTQMKLLALYIKPLIIQFVILIFGLQLLRTYKGFIMPIYLFGWVPGYFAIYFITYLLTVQLLKMQKVI